MMPMAEIFQKIRFFHNKFMKFAEIAIFGLFNYKLLENPTCWSNSAAKLFSASKNLSDSLSLLFASDLRRPVLSTLYIYIIHNILYKPILYEI